MTSRNHGLLLLLCGVIVLLVLVVALRGGGAPAWLAVLLIACPILHIGMMRKMHPQEGSGGHEHGPAPAQGKMRGQGEN